MTGGAPAPAPAVGERVLVGHFGDFDGTVETAIVEDVSARDGWILLRYPDSDKVWTPPDNVRAIPE